MKQVIFFMTIFLSFNILASQDNQLFPYTSDGCSMAPDNEFIGGHDWLECCVEHDKHYWIGGTSTEKDIADSNFKQCLTKTGMSSVESEIYYLAVQYGGSPHLGATWKWGYGWKNDRGYSALTKKEIKEEEQYSELFDLPIRVVTPHSFFKVFGDFGTKNYCKEDMINRLGKITGIKNTKYFYVVRIDDQGGSDAFQVFTPQCKGGYFYVVFKQTLAPDRCVLNNYYSMPDQVESITAYGQCESFL
jgi:hypothetical protein